MTFLGTTSTCSCNHPNIRPAKLSECLRKADTSTLDANTIVWNRRRILYISKQYKMLNMRKWRPTPSLTENNNNNNKISQLSLLLNDCDDDASETTSPKDFPIPYLCQNSNNQPVIVVTRSLTHPEYGYLFACTELLLNLLLFL